MSGGGAVNLPCGLKGGPVDIPLGWGEKQSAYLGVGWGAVGGTPIVTPRHGPPYTAPAPIMDVRSTVLPKFFKTIKNNFMRSGWLDWKKVALTIIKLVHFSNEMPGSFIHERGAF